MAHGKGSSLGVQFAHIHFTNLLAAELIVSKRLRVHGNEVRQNLSSKGLVNLKYTDIRLEIEIVPAENFLRAVGRTKKQLLKWIARLERPISDVCERFETKFESSSFAHDQRCRGTICQEGGVGRSVSSVWFDKCGLQLSHLFHRRISLDSIFLR